MTEWPDEVLLQHCRRGAQGAWAVLVRRYQRLIYTIPLRAGLDSDSAADVFQFAFARLHEHLERIDDASRLRAWLVTTAKRETLRLLELNKRQVDLHRGADDGEGEDDEDPLDRFADESPLAEEQLAALQQQHLLRMAVERLDERSRRLVELLFLQEEPLPYSLIAQRLGIAEGSIGPTRSRCLAKLRRVIDELSAPARG